jgi:SAM-dependent methyltransferase
MDLAPPAAAPVPLESPPCLLCGGADFAVELEGVRDLVWRKPGAFQLARCRACGLVMTRPRPTAEGLNFYYAGAYSAGGEGTDAVDMAGFYTGFFGRLLNRYRLVTIEKVQKLGAGDHLLDVGCSQGFFLDTAHAAAGCAVSGIDLDAGSIRLAEARGGAPAGYTVGRLVDDPLAAQSVSVVTFFECLEHDPDPVRTLTAARRVLRPGGLVVVEVPNWRSLWRITLGRWWMPLLCPQHLVHFTPDTLRATLRAAGFETVHHQTMLFPIELVTSVALWLGTLIGPKARDPGPGRRLVEAIVGLHLHLLFWTVEVPVAFWSRVFGVAGHQTIIGRAPSA